MQITYLILAHENPTHLKRLVNALSASNVRFLIHIDEDSQIEEFKRFFTYSDLKTVYFITKRSRSEWGTFGIVEATLNCLKFILKKIPETDRVILLSGKDYPIKSNNQILKYLSKNKDKIFLNYFKVPYKRWGDGGRGRFPFYEKINEMIPIHVGSQWMSFPMYVLPIIFEFLKINEGFVPYFKSVFIPDESFFQTLLLNCEEEIVERNLVARGLHLIKWDCPFNHPRIFDESCFNLIKKSGYLFARKFSGYTKSRILDRIDNEILSIERTKTNKVLQNISTTQAFLFLTDKNNTQVLQSYKTLKEQTKVIGNTFLAYHKKRKKISKLIAEYDPFVFDGTILKGLNFEAMGKALVPGSNHFPLFKFFEENPNYGYYWIIEDDVRFNGNWQTFFSQFNTTEIDSDFLSSHLISFYEEPEWYWWDTLKNISGKRISNLYKVKSLNSIFRISNRAMVYLKDSFLNGKWVGHYEVSIPTLLNYGGFKINDFGGKGEFTIGNFEGKFYKSATDDLRGILQTGSMRFGPFIDHDEITDEFLYHQIKSQD